jgi:hypothetical protein
MRGAFDLMHKPNRKTLNLTGIKGIQGITAKKQDASLGLNKIL